MQQGLSLLLGTRVQNLFCIVLSFSYTLLIFMGEKVSTFFIFECIEYLNFSHFKSFQILYKDCILSANND